jgi:hypothetical protein
MSTNQHATLLYGTEIGVNKRVNISEIQIALMQYCFGSVTVLTVGRLYGV